MKNDRERALDFEKIRRQKQARRRRKIVLIVAAAVAAALLVGTVVVVQVMHVTDGSRDFWGNFGSSITQQAGNDKN